ncbi:MAG: DUF2341 domain-containing protein, partial [Candidatus Omnitrophota bacterium]
MALRNKNVFGLRTAIIAIALFCCPVFSYALPQGAKVTQGSATVEYSSDNTALTITAATDKVVIDYSSFSIAANEVVNFIQNSVTSAALNRVTGSSVSDIAGTLTANGIIYLINSNGINIASTANINAAGFLASTLNITNADFLSGKYKFFQDGANSFIVNRGNIHIRNGGYVILLSQAVQNLGNISVEASLGTVVLASGEAITLALDDAADISVVIDKAVQSEVFGPDGNKFDSAVKNTGSITANGGKIILTAKVLNKVFDYAVNNTGVIQATSVENHNGVIELVAQGAPIINSGTLDAGKISISALGTEFINIGKIIADGVDGLPNGGLINIQAGTILQQGLISANALEGGTAGEVTIVSETATVLDEGSSVEARALGIVGVGGRVTVNSTGGNTTVNKNAVIDVSAGSGVGDAGFIEVSAYKQLGFFGILSGRAPPGYKTGTAILDPDDLIVEGGIYNVNTTFTAVNNLTVRGDLTVNNGSLTFIADNNNDGVGDFYQEFGLIKTTSSTAGDISISGVNVTVRAIQSAKDLQITAKNLLTIAPTWGHKGTFTISYASLGITSDLSDFPVLVKLTSVDFDLSNSNIRFVDSQGHALSYEVEKWSISDGVAYIWVKLPTLSHSSDTTFYMYYDNNSALPVDAFNNSSDVWSANYVMVQHMDGDYSDSTSNNNNGTNVGDVNTVDGEIGDASNYSGISNNKIVVAYSNRFNELPLTISLWVKADSLNQETWTAFLGNYTSSSSNGWNFDLYNTGSSNGYTFYYFGDSQNKVYPLNSLFGSASTSWVYLTVTVDSSGLKAYRDGQLLGIYSWTAGSAKNATQTAALAIGESTNNYKPSFDGAIDEVWISHVTRSADWIKASYINETTPAAISGTASVTGGLTATGKVTLSSEGAITSTNNQVDITANSLILSAVNGIGSGCPLKTAVAYLQAINSSVGNIEIDNTGNLTISGNGISNLGGDVKITTHSDLILVDNITASGTVTLNIAGAVADNHGGYDDIVAAGLELITINGITTTASGMNSTLEIQVGKLAAHNIGSGVIDILNTGTLTVTTVGSTSGVTNDNGNVILATKESGNNLILEQSVKAPGKRVTLDINGAVYDDHNGYDDVVADELKLLTVNGTKTNMSWPVTLETQVNKFAAYNSGSGVIDILNTGDLTITTVDGTVGVTNNGGNVAISTKESGNDLILEQSVKAPGNTVTLNIAGAVADNHGGYDDIVAAGLELITINGITTTASGMNSTLEIQVGKLAAHNIGSGVIDILNTGTLTVTTVGSTSGVTNDNGNVILATKESGNNLILEQSVKAPGKRVTLDINGAVYDDHNGYDDVVADELKLLTVNGTKTNMSWPVTLETQVNKFAAYNSGSGVIDILNTGDLTITTVDGTVGVTNNGGNVAISTRNKAPATTAFIKIGADGKIVTNGGNITLDATGDVYVYNISTDGKFTGVAPTSGTVNIKSGGNIEDAYDDGNYDISALNIVLDASGGIGTISPAPIELRYDNLTIITKLIVSPVTSTYGDTVNLTAILTAGSTGVSGKTVTFTVNSVNYIGTTNVNGVATATVTGLNASSYPISASFAGDTSYAATSGTGTMTVNKADAVISVVATSGLIYNGSAQVTATGTASGVETPASDLSGLLTVTASHTNAGTYTDSWSFAGNTNYNATSGTVSTSIGKADAVISVVATSGLIYNGSAQVTATGTASGVETPASDLSGLLTVTASHTNAGTYTDSWSFAGNTNYNATSGTVSTSIGKAD